MESILPNALPNTLSSESVLGILWNLLVKVRHREVLSREEAQLLEQSRSAARTYGEPILKATSLKDLDARIAEVVETADLHGYWLNMVTSAEDMREGLLRKAVTHMHSGPDVMEVLGSVLSGGALRHAEQAVRYLETSAKLMPLIMDTVSEMDPKVLEISPIDLIYDQRVPSEIAEALYEGQCGNAVNFALHAALLREEKLEPWLSIALTERWARALKSNLRLLALDEAMAAQVPESVLPRGERFDPAAIRAQQEQLEAAFRALNEAAERAGAPVYPADL